MKVKKYLMILLITCLISLSCLTVVSAFESNATTFTELQNDLNNYENMLNDMDDPYEYIITENEQKYTFYLNNDVKLTDDEKNNFKEGIEIKNIDFLFSLNIDGKNHKIDANGNARIFKVNCFVNFNNIVFTNGKIDGSSASNDYYGGAILTTDSISVNNCTFSNNYADDRGGAIYLKKVNYNTHPSISVYNSVFINNKVDDDSGGAIYSEAQLNIQNSYFENNVANKNGGATYCFSEFNIAGTTFKSNSAKYGGAFYVSNDESNFHDEYKQININNCIFELNKCNEKGGAIYIENIESTIINSEFKSNNAKVDGGAIYSTGNIKVNNSKFTSNICKGSSLQCYGGAICCNAIECYNCVFENNIAYDYGGAIFTKGKTTIKNSVFKNNEAKDNHGGAICIWNDGNHIISDCKFENNKAKEHGASVYLDSHSSHVTIYHNTFYGEYAGSGKGEYVYTHGYFDKIERNYYYTANPNFRNHFYEHINNPFAKDKKHSDSNPCKSIEEYNSVSTSSTYNNIVQVKALKNIQSAITKVSTPVNTVEVIKDVVNNFAPKVGNHIVKSSMGLNTMVKLVTKKY